MRFLVSVLPIEDNNLHSSSQQDKSAVPSTSTATQQQFFFYGDMFFLLLSTCSVYVYALPNNKSAEHCLLQAIHWLGINTSHKPTSK